MKAVFAIVIAASVTTSTSPVTSQTPSASALHGAWRVVSTTDTGSVNDAPQPGIFMFTESHYSMVLVLGRQPRPDVGDLATASHGELVAAFGPAFNAQAGTYRLGSGAIEMTAEVAKSPRVMRSRTPVMYRLAFDGNDILLTTTGASALTYRLRRLD